MLEQQHIDLVKLAISGEQDQGSPGTCSRIQGGVCGVQQGKQIIPGTRFCCQGPRAAWAPASGLQAQAALPPWESLS